MEIMTQEAGQHLGPSTSTAGSVVPTQYLAGTVYTGQHLGPSTSTAGSVVPTQYLAGTVYTGQHLGPSTCIADRCKFKYRLHLMASPGAINQYCQVQLTVLCRKTLTNPVDSSPGLMLAFEF